uniref:Putative ovule protein n=1 Tax=Solanum chacoense TaxID=4108 RepID=A0A0V0H9X8_SOLCH
MKCMKAYLKMQINLKSILIFTTYYFNSHLVTYDKLEYEILFERVGILFRNVLNRKIQVYT